MAASTTIRWNIWCELPNLSTFPGYFDSGNRACESQQLTSRQNDASNTAYIPAPRTYKVPWRNSHDSPICDLIWWNPKIRKPCSTGKIADRPIATNIPARYGRHCGVRNAGSKEMALHPTPKELIYVQVSSHLKNLRADLP